MARRLFFVPEVRRGMAELSGADAEHLVRVLRAETGQIYEISDNQQRYLAKIETARKSEVVFRIIEPLPGGPAKASVHLCPALFKFDRFEWMVEKATELGVTTIRPFEAVRTERGLKQAAAKRLSRWERIALESSQQSRRSKLPEVHEAAAFDAVVAAQFNVRLMLDEADAEANIVSIAERCSPVKSANDEIGLLVGPEGGWTDSERRTIVEAGWQTCSLGSNILRAETAAIAGLSIIDALWMR